MKLIMTQHVFAAGAIYWPIMFKCFKSQFGNREASRGVPKETQTKVLSILIPQLVDNFVSGRNHSHRNPVYERRSVCFRSSECEQLWQQAWQQWKEAFPDDPRAKATDGKASNRSPPKRNIKQSSVLSWALKPKSGHSRAQRPLQFVITPRRSTTPSRSRSDTNFAAGAVHSASPDVQVHRPMNLHTSSAHVQHGYHTYGRGTGYSPCALGY